VIKLVCFLAGPDGQELDVWNADFHVPLSVMLSPSSCISFTPDALTSPSGFGSRGLSSNSRTNFGRLGLEDAVLEHISASPEKIRSSCGPLFPGTVHEVQKCTSMSFLLAVSSKCTVSASHAAPW